MQIGCRFETIGKGHGRVKQCDVAGVDYCCLRLVVKAGQVVLSVVGRRSEKREVAVGGGRRLRQRVRVSVCVGACVCVCLGESVECQARSFVGGRVKRRADGSGTGHDCTAEAGVRGVQAS